MIDRKSFIIEPNYRPMIFLDYISRLDQFPNYAETFEEHSLL